MQTDWCLPILLTTLLLLPVHTLAADAEVLPKGNFAFNLDYKHYIPWDERYNKDGDTEDAATDFNAVLGANIFPELAFFGPGSNIGTTVTDFEFRYDKIEATLAYGMTDNLSIGVKIPYIRYKNKVKTDLVTTDANVGKNTLYQAGILPEPFNSAPLLPLGAPGTVAMTPDDIQSLIGGGLDVNGDNVTDIPGYGYKRFETWEEEGLGDIEAGAKYRYYRDDNWRLAVLGGILFPTGEAMDPDNLAGEALGGDCYGLLFRSFNDYTGFRNLTLNASFYYTWTLPYDSKQRIVADANHPLSDVKETVDTDPGDVFEVEASAKYHFDETSPLAGFSAELLYHFTKGYKSVVTGPGPDNIYAGLEDQSDGKEHIYVARIAYSTIPLFLKKEFPIPMDLSLAYRNKFKGNNQAYKTEYLEAGLTIYF